MVSDNKIQLQLTDSAKDWLVRYGFDPVFGARPLRRLIQKEILNHLAMFLLQGDYQESEVIQIDAEGEQLLFSATTPKKGKNQQKE